MDIKKELTKRDYLEILVMLSGYSIGTLGIIASDILKKGFIADIPFIVIIIFTYFLTSK